jgi:hypothetical protein
MSGGLKKRVLMPQALRSVFLVNVFEGTAASLANMIDGHSEHTATTLNGSVYVFGGSNGPESKAEAYNTKTNTWRSI